MQPGIGIRLVDAPVERSDDPRAHVYIVDHVAPGAIFDRRIEVSNGTDSPVTLDLYPIAALIEDGEFVPLEGRSGNELTEWIDVAPSQVELPPHSRQMATVTVTVPDDATLGERYAAVVAELPVTEPDDGVAVAPRVGIRVYLSVGFGAEPPSDFVVDSLTARRADDGQPVIDARVENTGGRALDFTGELMLTDGPGGTSAGPFPAARGTTLAPGGEGTVSVFLPEGLPAGPWNAALTLESGRLSRTVSATTVFPDAAGESADAVDAEPVDGLRRWLIPLAIALLILMLLAFLLFFIWWKRRRDEEEEEEHRRAATGGNGQRSAERQRDEAGVGER